MPQGVIRTIIGDMKVVSILMTALADLQAEDTSLTATVAQVIGDWATTLENALADGNDTAIEQVVSDMKADAASLTASDPVLNPPAGTTTPTSPTTL
jgi:hypothetical protein